MRAIRLHDTRSGELRLLDPRDPGRVGIYACGPTVYSRIHIGNARPYVVFTLLKRFLEHEGYDVNLVVNVTDVNDKIYDAARRSSPPQPRPSAELATEMTAHYKADTDALGIGRPDHEPLASETIAPIVEYIAALVESGHAYPAGGDVYFRVRSDPGYGSLSHRRLEDMDQGEGEVSGRGAGAGHEDDAGDSARQAAHKEDPLDFALWKAHKPDEDTVWESPWGPGRPGWHIECSAMAEQFLGIGFDIHGGGSDLVFPHHENEAAQTRAARGSELANIWMHNGMIQSTGEKMAKSVGNIAPLHEVIERYGAATVVMYLISGHYRQPLAFSPSELQDADRRVQRIRDALRRLDAGQSSPSGMAHHRDAFFDALTEDFNTPRALASLFEWVREANRRTGGTGGEAGGPSEGGDEMVEGVGDADLREMLGVLGLGELTPLEATGDVASVDPEAVALLARRERARTDRDYQEADRLREELRARGWEIRDGSDGAELIPAGGL
jgi:cysteinyl-tRNA synthetase